MTKTIMTFLLSFFVFTAYGISDPNHMPTIEGSKEFNRIKILVGTWEGTSDMGMLSERRCGLGRNNKEFFGEQQLSKMTGEAPCISVSKVHSCRFRVHQ